VRVAFIIFDGMTSLDLIGVYDPVTRLRTMGFMPDLEWEICAYTKRVTDYAGLRYTPTKVGGSLANYDMVIVPGGFGTRKLIDDDEFIEWLRTATPCRFKVSVCTGSLLLGAAGFLKGKKATTHRNEMNELRKFCKDVVGDRVVDEGDVITGRGVTSSIDLGLCICEKLSGAETRERIREQMDYHPSAT